MSKMIVVDFGKNGGIKTVKRADCFPMTKLIAHYKANNTNPFLIRSLMVNGEIAPIMGLKDETNGKDILAFWLTENAQNLINIK